MTDHGKIRDNLSNTQLPRSTRLHGSCFLASPYLHRSLFPNMIPHHQIDLTAWPLFNPSATLRSLPTLTNYSTPNLVIVHLKTSFTSTLRTLIMRMRDILILASVSVAASWFTHGPGQLDDVRVISGALKSNMLRAFTATELRCGPGHGKCPDGKCCSTAGTHTTYHLPKHPH